MLLSARIFNSPDAIEHKVLMRRCCRRFAMKVGALGIRLNPKVHSIVRLQSASRLASISTSLHDTVHSNPWLVYRMLLSDIAHPRNCA